ncbi:MAG: hypothetical protein N2110_08640 [Flavobacteriales bacterium]|nr:hypothetical protein [Flavobacteriales bacterium]MCX7769070.1 hypothetical protein [Flavobacteriales bacterium]MDW8410741.1 hypothetical protein [Flavobacteriales bacterium]
MKKIFLCTLTVLCLSLGPLYAQCSVCRATVENAEEEGSGGLARGINNGVLYLMAIPYLMGGVSLLVWWVMRRQKSRHRQAI